MNCDPTVRIGLVGCGDISHAHGKAAQAIQDKIKIVSCCDIQDAAARTWAEQYECDSCYTDYTEMIGAEQLDAVLLATWPNQHREQIERCLDAGIRNILCEKALALTGTEALEIQDLVQTHDAYLMEGFMYRHHPAIACMDDVLASGQLGSVDSVRADFSAFDAESEAAHDDNRNWRQRKECGGGIPYDFACYCVNACNHFAGGLPERVYCRGDVSELYGTINRMYAFIEYDNGVVGIIESSKKADVSQRLEIVGARGRLVLPISWTAYNEIAVEEQRSCGWVDYKHYSHVIPKADSYQRQLENFAAVIRKQERPVMSLVESVINTFTNEALINSLENRDLISVSLPSELLTLTKETEQ
jgi:predicted dehydrogenase